MSAICNQCIGTSDYRRGPRANVCLNVSPLFCLHGEFGSPCLGFIAFDPVYVCTHYNNSPREGSPVAVLTSEGVRVTRLLQLRLQTFAHQRQEGAMTPWLPALGEHLIIYPDNGWMVMVMVCRGRGSQWSHNYTDTDTAVALGKMVFYIELQNPLSGTKLKPKFRKIIVLRDWHASGWKGHHWKNF